MVFVLLACCLPSGVSRAQATEKAAIPAWIELPQLPEALGGQCVGTSGDWLLVAGGSSWTAAPWSGGVKQWSDRIYGLRKGDARWTLLGHLPYAAGYFAAATWKHGLLCAGGENATEVFARVLQLDVGVHGKLALSEQPALPHPVTLARAAVSHNTLVVAGGHGLRTAHSVDAPPQMFTLSLPGGGAWKAVTPPWKNTLEIPEVAACDDGTVLIAGGAGKSNAASKAVYQTDAWSYEPSLGQWTTLPSLPHPVTGGTAVCSAQGHWLILGGDDGSLADQMVALQDHHPGFQKSVLAFDPAHHTWTDEGAVPLSLLGSGGVVWNGLVVLPGGEDRPAHRSTRVLAVPVSAFP